MELLSNFIQLFAQAAPWLCLGLLIAGIIHTYIPQQLMAKQFGDGSFSSILKASLIGAPLPLCSCGVIPTALSLRKSGASRGATASFLVSTPETGVDSISISYAMLGPVMAIVRPVSAIISAIVTGMTVQKFGNDAARPMTETSSCCHSGTKKQDTPTNTQKLKSVFTYGFGQMIKETAHWLLIGLGFAAAVTTYIPNDFLAQWGDSIITMGVLVIVSIPMYVCATASTPIAAGLLLAGISPGAILVFMLAGPATNIALIGVVRAQLGTRSSIAYLLGVIGTAVTIGLGLDYVVSTYNLNVVSGAHAHDEILPIWLVYLSSGLLAISMSHAIYNLILDRIKA